MAAEWFVSTLNCLNYTRLIAGYTELLHPPPPVTMDAPKSTMPAIVEEDDGFKMTEEEERELAELLDD